MVGIIWSVSLASIGILGLVLAGRKSSVGWAVGLFAQLLWIVYALVSQQYGFILSALAYGYVYFTNWRKWQKEERRKAAMGQVEITVDHTLPLKGSR